MKTSLSQETIQAHVKPLEGAFADFASRYPGDAGRRQPVHTVYGGANLFKAGTAAKLGQIALKSLDTYAPDPAAFAGALGLEGTPELFATVYDRVRKKLVEEPVEDFRIDFEDGYGNRPAEEEDKHAVQAAEQVAQGMEEGNLPPFIGIRIKPFTPDLRPRSIRTLDLFLTTLAEKRGGKLPSNFVVTLPKVTMPEEVAVLAKVLGTLEQTLGYAAGSLKLEIMVETTQSIVAPDGSFQLPKLVEAAAGRCSSAHFGTYDYTALNEVVARYQSIMHPSCDFAKHVMKTTLTGTGVMLSDGATTTMPVAPHRPKDRQLTAEEADENRAAVFRAWRMHSGHVRHGLENGFYQGWDLHPAQLPIRYGTVYQFFLVDLDDAAERLSKFTQKAAQATLTGDMFDDAATGQGLLNFFLRATSCGAMTTEEATKRSGLEREELESRSFLRIVEGRRG